MADVDLKQVVESLKNKFQGRYQFIFWYDNDAEFEDNIEELSTDLEDIAKVVVLQPGHQLETKIKLNAIDDDKKVLVYSPAAQPILDENHLRDMVRYSDTFTADSKEILRKDLGLPESMRDFVANHMDFFGNKERRNAFATFELSSYQENPEWSIMATIVKLKTPLFSFFDILQVIMTANLNDNEYLAQFEKFNVLDTFWDTVKYEFNYNKEHDLVKFSSAMYLTTTFKQMDVQFPKSLSEYDLSEKVANVQTFMQQFGTKSYQSSGDTYSDVEAAVWAFINGGSIFKDMDINVIAKSDVFKYFDWLVLNWIQDRLGLEDLDAQINGQLIDVLIKKRSDMHFGHVDPIKSYYQMMKMAYFIVLMSQDEPEQSFDNIVGSYVDGGFEMDTYYRKFIYYYQETDQPEEFEKTKLLIEDVYVNSYLDKQLLAWNKNFHFDAISPRKLQRNFYKNYVEPETNRIVVIISDAFRFEAAKELQDELGKSSQVSEQKMDYMITGLPSVTYMGMPSLLPNETLCLDEKKLLVDGGEATDMKSREKILQSANQDSCTFPLDDLKGASTKDIREWFAGKQVVYIYHNQIDAIADNRKTEDDVFKATEETINDIKKLILRLRSSSINHFYVTADHGYIYRDAKLLPEDKIDVSHVENDAKSQRYMITSETIDEPGIGSQKLSDILNNNDDRSVYYPTTANIFKSAGSYNYVHGGSSPQEMIVPLLEVKSNKGKTDEEDVKLSIVSTSNKITSLEVKVSLMQVTPVSATVKPAVYSLYFVDDQNQLISGQVTVNANKGEDSTVQDRIFSKQIVLADRTYDKSKKYYLVIKNTRNGVVESIPYIMDITIPGGFGFDI
ncbi:BREX-1 system phosphatase PglZ type A [Companilactobacillus ginsenosidimutans]|uniref:Uncharacterized protein n=1 Tax=Companilactobacillus ginsenosidimutans TaxID=1007676 RepID=A0A0H4QFI4_9LACO|nr:BREX-1 system phosphatase PglZ type A [Companilactobacillus ginsenosidimutans]AKP67174.1 hypothetical protein ABM34_06240 [Companilactobacillus ginsenosidimutans]